MLDEQFQHEVTKRLDRIGSYARATGETSIGISYRPNAVSRSRSSTKRVAISYSLHLARIAAHRSAISSGLGTPWAAAQARQLQLYETGCGACSMPELYA